MPKGPQGGNLLRRFFFGLFVALALSDAIFGARIQAWYQTMPPATAKAVGASIIFGLLIVVCGIAMFLASRSSDA